MNSISPLVSCPTELVLAEPPTTMETVPPLAQPLDSRPVLAIVARDARAAVLLQEASQFTAQITQHELRRMEHQAPLREVNAVLVDLAAEDVQLTPHFLRQVKRSVLVIGGDVPYRAYDHYAAMAGADISVIEHSHFNAMFPNDYPAIKLETMAIHGIEGIAVVVHDSQVSVWGVLDSPWHYELTDLASAGQLTLDRIAAALAYSLAEIGECWTALQHACDLLGLYCVDGPLRDQPRLPEGLPRIVPVEVKQPQKSLVGHVYHYARALFGGRGT